LTYDIAFDDVVASLAFIGGAPSTATAAPSPTGTPTNTPTAPLMLTNTATLLPSFTPTNTPTLIASNTSTPGNTATSGPQSVLAFTPVADTYVQSDTPTTNYGSATQYVTDNSPIRNMLLKFTVSGIGNRPIVNVKLRLYCVDPSPFGGEFHRVADTTWGKGTLNWNTAPVADPGILATLGKVLANNWVEVDVTSLVTGDGTYSLKITSNNTDGAYYSTKEGAVGFASQLVITTGLAPTSTPTNVPTNTPITTLEFTSTPTDTPTPTDTLFPSDTPTASPTP